MAKQLLDLMDRRVASTCIGPAIGSERQGATLVIESIGEPTHQ